MAIFNSYVKLPEGNQMDFEPDFPVLPAPASSDLHIQRLLQPFHMLLILEEPDEPVVERGSIC